MNRLFGHDRPTWLSVLAKNRVPHLCEIFRYAGCVLKNSDSSSNAESIAFPLMMSCCDLLITPMNPNLSGYTLPFSISRAFVPASIKSSFVNTPIVLRPAGSIFLAKRSESEFAKSTFAGEMARMMLKSCASAKLTRGC